MDYDHHTQRGCLLPDNCKDLIDVLKLEAKRNRKQTIPPEFLASAPFDDAAAELERLLCIHLEWEDFFARQNAEYLKSLQA